MCMYMRMADLLPAHKSGVGWGSNVHSLAHFYDVTPRHVHLQLRTYVMLRWRCDSRHAGGGVDWGGAVTFTHLHISMMWRRHVHLHLRTYVMLRWRCFTSRWGGVGWGGVGWDSNVHSLAHFFDVTPRHVHLHLRTNVMLRWRCFTSRWGWGWVAWGGAVTFTHLRASMMWRHGTFTCTCAQMSCYVEDVSRHAGGGVGWGGAVTFTHLRTSMMQPLDNATTRKVSFRFGVQYKDVAPLGRTQDALMPIGLCWKMEYQIPLTAQLVVSPTKCCGCIWEVSSGVGNVMKKTSWPKLDKPWRRCERRKRIPVKITPMTLWIAF